MDTSIKSTAHIFVRNATLSQIMELKEKSLGELKAKYEELFNGQRALSNNKVYLWRKIAYRVQEFEYGSVFATATSPIQFFDEIVRNLSSTC